MKGNQNVTRKREINLDKVNEGLLNVLSLLILLEADMETQKSDDIHLRTVKIIHNEIKSIQKICLGKRSQTE